MAGSGIVSVPGSLIISSIEGQRCITRHFNNNAEAIVAMLEDVGPSDIGRVSLECSKRLRNLNRLAQRLDPLSQAVLRDVIA